ncbi:MAG: hypothetical protein KC561_05055 [Myxococcales bacterium]|nr:hypothetical protein [Myxococcales bacterium]
MTQLKVLITAPYFIPVVDEFREVFAQHGIEPVVLDVEERAEEEDLLPVIHEYDGVICGDDRFTDRVLEKATRLKAVCKWGTGIDSIDQEACARRGIAVKNTPDAFSESIYFLSNPDLSGFMTGQTVTVDGGVCSRLSSE